MPDVMELVPVIAFGVLLYMVYGVCRVDKKLCKLGVVGILLSLLAYSGMYIDLRPISVFIALILTVVAVAILSDRL